jgi:hypothetical protein
MMLLIGDREFRLAEDEDAGRVEAAALTAARAGAGFVRFTVEGGRQVAALVTPHVAVVFTDTPEEWVGAPDREHDDTASQFVNFDHW